MSDMSSTSSTPSAFAEQEFVLGTTDMVTLIRKQPKGTRFYLTIRMQLPIEDKPDHYLPGYTSLEVTKVEIIRQARKALEYVEKRGARMSARTYFYPITNSNSFYLF